MRMVVFRFSRGRWSAEALKPLESFGRAPGCNSTSGRKGIGAPMTSRGLARLGVLALAGAVASCAGISPAVVDNVMIEPIYFDTLNCPDLVAQVQTATARANELNGLMQKSATGTGGAVVNALAYQTDYAKARTTQKYAEDAARQKGCDLSSKANAKSPEAKPQPGRGDSATPPH